MNDDFNSPILINLFEGVRYINLMNDSKETLTASRFVNVKVTMNFIFDVLDLKMKK
jgi:cysteinyl-tRNA synthetase